VRDLRFQVARPTHLLARGIEKRTPSGSIDCDGSIVKSINQRWVSFLENNLRVALPSEGDPGEIGNLFSHVNVLSFWQICQTLVPAASGFSFFTLRAN
jgi:hypothetical protein